MLAIKIHHASASLPKYASGVKRNKTGLIYIETVVSVVATAGNDQLCVNTESERKCDLTVTQVHFMKMCPLSPPVFVAFGSNTSACMVTPLFAVLHYFQK